MSMMEERTTAHWPDLDTAVEFRDMGREGKWIGGYAVLFAPRESADLGGFAERWDRQAFGNCKIQGWPHVVCGFNYDPYAVLGTARADTLRLTPDRIGLDWMAQPPEARADVRELIERGDLRYTAATFTVPPGGDEWGLDKYGRVIRTVTTAHLLRVQPVLSVDKDIDDHLVATAGYESLAAWANITPAEVRDLAGKRELTSLFTKAATRDG